MPSRAALSHSSIWCQLQKWTSPWESYYRPWLLFVRDLTDPLSKKSSTNTARVCWFFRSAPSSILDSSFSCRSTSTCEIFSHIKWSRRRLKRKHFFITLNDLASIYHLSTGPISMIIYAVSCWTAAICLFVVNCFLADEQPQHGLCSWILSKMEAHFGWQQKLISNGGDLKFLTSLLAVIKINQAADNSAHPTSSNMPFPLAIMYGICVAAVAGSSLMVMVPVLMQPPLLSPFILLCCFGFMEVA